MTKSQLYPTDLKRSEWEALRGLLPTPNTTGRPREHSWHSILNGIFYIVKSGCPWLSKDWLLETFQILSKTIPYKLQKESHEACAALMLM